MTKCVWPPCGKELDTNEQHVDHEKWANDPELEYYYQDVELVDPKTGKHFTERSAFFRPKDGPIEKPAPAKIRKKGR